MGVDRPQRRPRRGLRPLAADRRRAAAVRRHQRQRGLRLPRRGPGHHAAGVRAGGRARGADRRPGLLPGPGRLRPARDGRAAGRAGRRGRLPDRRAGGLRPGGRARASSYVKPHGALYNRVVHDEEQAAAVVDGVLPRGDRAARARPARLAAARGGRRGRAAGRHRGLRRPRVHRRRARWCRAARTGAVVTDPDAVVRTVASAWPGTGVVTSRYGQRVAVRARSLCLHGDTPGAVGPGPPGPASAGGRRASAWRPSYEGRCRSATHGAARRAGLAATRPRRCTPSCCAAARRAPCRRSARSCPAARTVLLDGLADPGRAGRRAHRLARSRRSPRARGDAVEIPVRYDGPDLAEVAALWGVPAEEVARIHAATEFRVAFCGFAPGFGYLTGLPAAAATYRAGPPRAPPSRPARWRWRPVHRRLPALLARRLAADRDHGRGAVGPRARAGRAALAGHPGALRPGGPPMTDRALAVVRAGALTTVQDLGRPGPRPPRRAPVRRPRRARAAASPTGWSATARGAAVLETTLNGCALRPRCDGHRGRRRARPARSRSTAGPAAWGAPVRVPAGRGAGRRPGRRRACAATWPSPAASPSSRSSAAAPPICCPGSGPPPLTDGAVLPLGDPTGPPRARGRGRRSPRPRPNWSCAVPLGPARRLVHRRRRCARFAPAAYRVSSASNRIGLRTEGPPWSGPGPANCPARAWSWAPSRSRRTAGRWSSSPTTRRPAATR